MKTKIKSASMATLPQMDRNLSDTQSVSSMDAFSANDLNVNAEDEDVSALESVNEMQYMNPTTGHDVSSMPSYGASKPPPLTDSLLYSFSDLSTKKDLARKEVKVGLTDSFGIALSPKQVGSSKLSPKVQSPQMSSTVGQNDRRPSHIGSGDALPQFFNQKSLPISDRRLPSPNEVASPLSSYVGSSVPASNQVPGSSQMTGNPLPNQVPSETPRHSSSLNPQDPLVKSIAPAKANESASTVHREGKLEEATGVKEGHNTAINVALKGSSGSLSREATPTPEPGSLISGVSDSNNTGKDRELDTSGMIGYQPKLLSGMSSGGVLVSSGSESTLSEECGEREVPYHAGGDSDVAETGSVVSVQQLAEDYLSLDPTDLERVALPSDGTPITLPAVASSPKSKVHNKPSHKLALKESPAIAATSSSPTPSPSRMPTHITAMQPVERTGGVSPRSRTVSASSDSIPPCLPESEEKRNVVDGNENTNDREKELEEELAEERKARIRLEGQLETLSEEYEMALGDRSDLLNKLGRSNARLDEIREAFENEKERNSKLAAQVEAASTLSAPASAPVGDSEDAEQQKDACRNLQLSLVKEKQKSDRLEKELDEVRQCLDQAEFSVGDLQDKIRQSHAELQKKNGESEERLCKLSALEASYESLEKNKQWLHEQLQEGLKAKFALQEEVREAKASSIAQAIKTDQVLQENALLQQQVNGLQKGVLMDKEKLVSQLEEIEAGVLSREDLCSKLVAERNQLENRLKLKEETLSKLSGDLGRLQVEKDELQEQLVQATKEAEIAGKVGDLEKANKGLNKKLENMRHAVELKETECNELERTRSSLHEKLRQAEVEGVTKDGIIQTMNEAKDMLQRELDLVNESKEGVEKELEDAKCEVARVEADVRAALDKCSEKDLLLNRSSTPESGQEDIMKALLATKEEEIKEKESAIKSLEEQVGDLVKEFTALQSNVNAQRGTLSDSIAEKDRVISHLSACKEKSEQELESLREETDGLQDKMSQLKHERARLQGQVEGSVQPSDYQKALQDKAEMQATLNAEKLKYQQDQLKSQGKVNRLEREHRESQKIVSTLQNDLKRAQDVAKESLEKMKGDNSLLLAKLKETEEKLRVAEVGKNTESSIGSSRPSSDYVSALRAQCDELRKENQALVRDLEEELDQKRKAEKANGQVVFQIKKNFENEKKKLLEKNREQSFDLERMQGKLEGLQSTQSTLREHTSSLETSLAQKEASVMRLSGKVQKLSEENETESQQLKAQIGVLGGQVKEKVVEVSDYKHELNEERKKVEDAEQDLQKLKVELSAKKAELSRLSVEDTPRLKELVTTLGLEKETLLSDLSYHKSQLLIAKTSADSARREITDKVSQIEILERQLAIAESQYQQASDDVKRLKEHMRSSDRLQAAGILGSLKGGVRTDLLGRESGSRLRKKRDRGNGSDQPLDASLSSMSGTEEVDHSSLNQSGLWVICYVFIKECVSLLDLWEICMYELYKCCGNASMCCMRLLWSTYTRISSHITPMHDFHEYYLY